MEPTKLERNISLAKSYILHSLFFSNIFNSFLDYNKVSEVNFLNLNELSIHHYFMKKLTALILYTLFFWVPSFAQTEKSSYKTIADSFEANYNSDNYESIFITFSSDMQKALPIDKTKEFLKGLKQQVGKISNREFIKYENTYASYKTLFERAILTLNISVDNDSKINGLFVKPYKADTLAINHSSIDEKGSTIILKTTKGNLAGTLLVANSSIKTPVVLIIAGSGPTDRNGNNPMAANGSLKLLAEGLFKNGISSLRYDKRGIGESRDAGKNEADVRFEDNIDDARSWINLLKDDKRFSKVIVIGHSEGSLIGMVASANNVNKFISLAGAGRSADNILKNQLSAQPDNIKQMIYPIIDSLKVGKKIDNISPMLFSLFRPQIQPYLISWFKYDPQIEISKLKIPIQIIQGTSDLQVNIDDANNLKQFNKNAELKLINKMNHIFRIVGDSKEENLASYNNSLLPISDELVSSIVTFIK